MSKYSSTAPEFQSGNGDSSPDIPASLTNEDAWVFWKYQHRDGKPTKVLGDPHSGQEARSTDPKTWGSFNEAVLAKSKYGGAGVGIVFDSESSLAGVDLDDCIDDTGELYPEAREIVDQFASYTEVSPSGTGVKVFIHGVKPGESCRTTGAWGGDIELYDQGRFFTVTGNHIPGTPGDVYKRQSAYMALYKSLFAAPEPTPNNVPEAPTMDDTGVLEAIRRSKQGDKFARLFDTGDTSGYPSQSEARYALIGMLRFYSADDPYQLESLMRRANLDQSKWDSRREGKTLIQYEIARATAEPLAEYYGQTRKSQSPNVPIDEFGTFVGTFMDESQQTQEPDNDNQAHAPVLNFGAIGRPDPVDWYIDKLAPAGGHMNIIYGAGGEGKSFVAMDQAIAVAGGFEYWLGHKVTQTPVLYLDFELDEKVQSGRAYDLAAGRGLSAPPDNLYYLSALEMGQAAAFTRAYRVCEEYGIGLVYLDSFGPAMMGDSESSKDVLEFLETYIKPFKAMGVSVSAIDHQSKKIKGENNADKLPFGSVYKTNMARSVTQVKGEQSPNKDLEVTLRHAKANLGPFADTVYARIKFQKQIIEINRVDSDALETRPATAEDEIRAAFSRSSATVDQVAEKTGLEKKTVQNRVRDMRDRSVLYPTGDKDGRAPYYALYQDPLEEVA